MTDRPIIFSAPMVRALLAGTKTQTRRVLRAPAWAAEIDEIGDDGYTLWCVSRESGCITPALPQYLPGDRLWVRESHAIFMAHGQQRADDQRWGPWGGLPMAVDPNGTQVAYYREGFDRCSSHRWRPSIHMPRWASRLTLTVTDVRVQRLQEISEADAEAEGATSRPGLYASPDWSMDWSEIGNHSRHVGRALRQEDIALGSPRWAFASYWNSIHSPDAWNANPWVCALTFTVERRNIDAERPA